MHVPHTFIYNMETAECLTYGCACPSAFEHLCWYAEPNSNGTCPIRGTVRVIQNAKVTSIVYCRAHAECTSCFQSLIEMKMKEKEPSCVRHCEQHKRWNGRNVLPFAAFDYGYKAEPRSKFWPRFKADPRNRQQIPDIGWFIWRVSLTRCYSVGTSRAHCPPRRACWSCKNFEWWGHSCTTESRQHEHPYYLALRPFWELQHSWADCSTFKNRHVTRHWLVTLHVLQHLFSRTL
jgi:hypothetical protein